MPSKFVVGDLVWAKMKRFPSWPGRVSDIPSNLKRPKNIAGLYCIYFFGSDNYGWIDEPSLVPYLEGRDKLTQLCKTTAFKEAVSRIDAYIADPSKFNARFNSSEAESDFKFNELKEDKVKVDKPAKPAKKASPGRKRSHASAFNSTEKSHKSFSLDNNTELDNEVDNETDSMEDPVVDISTIQSFETNHASKISSLYDNKTIHRPTTPPIDLKIISNILPGKNVKATSLKIGFLGLGIMGRAIVKNLIHSGHKVIVWNRTRSKCNDFVNAGAEMCLAPCEVVDAADIIFSCVPDPQSAKEMVFGNCGVLQSITMPKGYVEMTGIDAESSHDIADAIVQKGGRYLEAQIQGSKLQAEEGSLIILAAGDRELFADCNSCFKAIGNNCLFLGAVGTASRMNLVLQTINGIALTGLVEAMALADRAGLQKKDVLEILEMTSIASPAMIEKSNAIILGDYSTHMRLNHMQKDLRLALGMAEQLVLPLPVAASANEVHKHAKRLGFGEDDVSALYFRARF